MTTLEKPRHDVGDEGPEPRGRTLVIFGIGLLVMIVGIIVVAAILGR
jgi:hypothetical protein